MKSKQPSSTATKNAKIISSAAKEMASILGYVKGIVFTNYLQNIHTFKGEYYAKLMS